LLHGSASWPIAIAAEELPAFAFEKSDLKLFSDFGNKIYNAKPALPNNFSLGPKGFWDVFNSFVVSKFFASWDAQTQTLQKTLTLEKLGFKLFSDFGKKVSM
jgi:hypothetical protein